MRDLSYEICEDAGATAIPGSSQGAPRRVKAMTQVGRRLA